jgi:glycosyltransferase involved in cell wall biosynthesis
MIDISVIILVGKEKLHIQRCLEHLVPLEPRQVFVVESQQPDDGTHEISIKTAKALAWQVEENNIHLNNYNHDENTTLYTVFHAWPGLYAKQFNWALDNLPIKSQWILRMDADEYLTEETIKSIKKDLIAMPGDVSGLNIELKRKFMGGEIRHGTTGIRQARIFRYGIGRCEDRAMDEHIVVSQGRIIDYDGAFYDDSLMPFEEWKEKHRGYAKREAMDAVSLFNDLERLKNPSETDKKKIKYYKLPRYLRAFVYFCIRYFLKLGCLDGISGFRWHFWQGLWYRWIVDVEIGKLKVIQ